MESTRDLSIAQVVKSKAGRDNGNIFIIYEIIDDKHVLVIDGDLRRLSKPKKKKIKHLIVYKDVINTLKEKIVNEERFNNAYVRKLLASYNEDTNS